ncbi:membrane protein [Arthrobacter phage VResidence]|uniref:Membrane protein n=1 Tax=Arthrobacter phage VResidence TaxID=2927294 RepID=A0A9X9P6V3_9CAUD|nr:membrane protein [Arthrobacter phage VResidence]
MPDFLPAILGFLGVVTGGVLSYFGVRFTARQNAKAAQDASNVSNRQVDVDEWKAIVAALREEVGRLSERVAVLETKRDTDRDTIEALESEAHAREARYRVALRFIRELLAWARTVTPDLDPPDPPELIREDVTTERNPT